MKNQPERLQERAALLFNTQAFDSMLAAWEAAVQERREARKAKALKQREALRQRRLIP